MNKEKSPLLDEILKILNDLNEEDLVKIKFLILGFIAK